MVVKLENDYLGIDYDVIRSKNIYCLYYRQYNIIIDCIMIEECDCIIAYSDRDKEIVIYRDMIITKEDYNSTQLYIKIIPNIISYK